MSIQKNDTNQTWIQENYQISIFFKFILSNK